MLPGVQETTREWTPTLPSELSLWELESQWTPESSEGDCKNQNSLNWKVFYIIAKLLEYKCLKWAHMTHLGTKTQVVAKRKAGSQIVNLNSQLPSVSPEITKIENHIDSLACKWHATYYWKTFDILVISRLPLGSPGTKWHSGVRFMPSHNVYYKGEGGGFPPNPGRGECCEFVFICGSSVHQKCSSYALTNLLFGLCRFMWVINLLVNFPSPNPGALTHPSTPEVLRAKKRTPTLMFVPLDLQWVHQGAWRRITSSLTPKI
jgi:hypothetical protein